MSAPTVLAIRSRLMRFEVEPVHGPRRSVDGIAYEVGARLGESPAWIRPRGLLASVDIESKTLDLLDPATSTVERVQLSRAATAVIPMGGPVLLLAMRRRLEAYDLDAQAGRPVPDRPGGPPSGTWFNDGKIDRGGRLWIGTRRTDARDGSGSLLSWDPGREPEVRATGMRVPNGLAWTMAGDRIYLADSRRRLILTWSVDKLGRLLDRRVFVMWSRQDGRPDGLTVDAQDHLWCAAWDGGAIRRYDPRGRLERTVRVPAVRPTSCAFGGPSLDRLWVTSARSPHPDPTDAGGSHFSIDVGQLGFDSLSSITALPDSSVT